ncbi:putative trap dicarboxylate transporter- dctp subunit [Treponema primitia ZAS-2]|uniref:Putative trap dicarboxylate transporter-dctp subunit n=1 Tax=Treponema primitia (strain ATCC BAA-887 / DSM 12427 / ZAS-2) TaxID=545694 RepID=F5YMY4_TREPZ|nr:putative trap dicarboxylate transporter- dctp subunit [Treponema primitia ZAS-2]
MLFFISFPAYSQRRPGGQITIKLATQVPASTPWGAALNRMAAEWAAATNGQVRLQIYPNGTQGNEADMLQKLNMNVIQAAVFTSFGLNRIAPEFLTLSCPFLIRSNAEMDLVFANLKPELEAKVSAQGLYPLAIVKGGWIKIFSKSPVFVPADLKRQRVGSDPQEPAMTQAFKSMGYQVTPIDGNRVLIALNGGTIDAIYGSPIGAAGLQLFGVAKNMASLNLAPFLGSVILNKHTWDSIPEQYRADILRITQKFGEEIEKSMMDLETEAILTMGKHGLVINDLNDRQLQEWYDDMNRVIPTLVDTTFDRNAYEKILALVTAYRNGR